MEKSRWLGWRLLAHCRLLLLTSILLSASLCVSLVYLWANKQQAGLPPPTGSPLAESPLTSSPAPTVEAEAPQSTTITGQPWLVFVPETEEQTVAEQSGVASEQDESQLQHKSTAANHWRPKRSRPERKPILNEFSFPPNLVQGMRFILVCQVLDGQEPVQIRWLKDGQELQQPQQNQAQVSGGPQEAERVDLVMGEELSSSLLFRHVQAHHSGNYTCLASNHFGSASYSSYMSVRVPPSWKVEPQDQHSITGHQISIDCQANGNPNPFIRWKFQRQLQAPNSQLQLQHQMPESAGEPLEATATASFKLIKSNHHMQTLENGSLSIRQLAPDHDGFYLCEAENGIEPSLIKVVRLAVHQQAHILEAIQVTGTGGASASRQHAEQLSTAAAAPPPPTSTTATSSTTSAGIAPVWLVRSPSSLSANNNNNNNNNWTSTSTVRLSCELAGETPLTVEWLKDGQQMLASHTAQPKQLPLGGLLPPTSGATDHHQQSQMAGAKLRYFVESRLKSWQQVKSELVLEGHLRRQDLGLFTCAARNSYGHDERQARLLLQEAPEAPQVVEVAHIGSRSVALRWLAPFDGNSAILKYLVEYKQLPDDWAPEQQLFGESAQPFLSVSEKSLPITGSSSKQQQQQLELIGQQQQHSSAGSSPLLQAGGQVQHTVLELEPMSRYVMRVVAVNELSRSRPSASLSLRTEEEVPSIVPTLAEAVVLSSNSIRLRWTISYSPAREIVEGFFLGYRSLDVSNPASTEQATFTYKTVRLASQAQEPHQQHYHLLPPAQLASPDTRQQQQQQRDSSAFITPVSTVTKNPSSSVPTTTNSRQPATTVISAFEYEINGLERNTEYSILIQCFNKKGAGPTSDPVVFKTLLNDPPGKLLLSASEITESSARISWKFAKLILNNVLPPASVAGELVDGFVLTYSKYNPQPSNELVPSANEQQPPDKRQTALLATGGVADQPASYSEQWQAIQLSPQQRSHQLKNLACGTAYSVKIWAFNKVGNGETSNLLTFSTRGKAPVAPDRRSFLFINSTQVKLYLSAWYDGGCEIEKFVVQYRIRGQLEWLLVSNNIVKEQLSLAIKDLNPATSYELLVAAYNQVGRTEVKYRFLTLDKDGRQPLTGGAFSSNDEAASGDGSPYEFSVADEGAMKRGEGWREAGLRSFAILRYLFNWPLVPVFVLCLVAALLLIITFFRSTESSSTGSSASSTSCTSSGATRQASRAFAKQARAKQQEHQYTESTNFESSNLSPIGELMGTTPPSGSSATDSPHHNHHHQQHQHQLNGAAGFKSSASTHECQYQPFCPESGTPDFRSMVAKPLLVSPYVATAGPHPSLQAQSLGPTYAIVQPVVSNASSTRDHLQDGLEQQSLLQQQNQQQQQQQQCLLQMLMMGSQNQKGDTGSSHYAPATLGRCNKPRCFSQQQPVYLATLNRDSQTACQQNTVDIPEDQFSPYS